MNFLTKTIGSTIGSLTGNSIPYAFGNKIITDDVTDPHRSNSIWNVYDATSNKDSSLVTVFEFDLKNPAKSNLIPLAKNCFKKVRSLSLLPGVLTVLDSFESDSYLYLVTERVRPLDDAVAYDYPEEGLPEDALLLGIYQISQALKFINNEGSSIHGNVCKSSIFVNQSGDWKLGGFELLSNLKEKDCSILNYAHQLPSFKSTLSPPEFQKNGASFLNTVNSNHAIKFDSFKLGVLIYELFYGVTVNDASQLVSMTKIPKSMLAHLKKLLNQSLTVRYSVEKFLKVGEDVYFNIPLILIFEELTQLDLKSNEEKMDVFQSVDELEYIPIGFFRFKILPELGKSFYTIATNENNFQSALLFIILKNCPGLDEPTFASVVKPILFKAFALPDRAIRMTLLNALPTIIENFTNYEVQDKIFPSLVLGFNDTNSSIREETLKAISSIASKISSRQLNNDLLRYMAKLQGDETPEIRTNTVIGLSKIAEHMAPSTRTGVLITAFSKALKDPFIPARLSAILAFESSIDYFLPDICCSRVLSAVAPALLDKSSNVRKEAEKTFDIYMKKIREAAGKLPEDEEDTMKQDQTPSNVVTGLSGLSLGKLGFGSKNSIFGFGDPSNNDSTASLTMKNSEVMVSTPSPGVPSITKNTFSIKTSIQDINDSDIDVEDDGWGFDMEDEPKEILPRKSVLKENKLSNSGSLQRSFAPIKQTTTPKALPQSQPKRSLKLQPKNKLKLDLDTDQDGWGDGW